MDGQDAARGTEPQPDPAPATDAPPQQVTITFRDNRGFEQSFKLKTNTNLTKAMNAFSAKVERPLTQLRFLIDGERVVDGATVETMQMEDGDVVEVHEEQIGGGA